MLAIRNFGHFWSKELIDWGKKGPGNSGALFASAKPDAIDWEVDFREQIGIYVLYDQDREAVYIGQTGSKGQKLFSRLRQHSRGQFRDRWTNFSWFGFLEVDQPKGPLKNASKIKNLSANADPEEALKADVKGSFRDALNEAEAVLLQILEPRLNKQGPSWNGAKEYFQFDPFDAEPSNAELMASIKKIEKALMAKML